MKKLLLPLLCLPTAFLSANLFLYDGFTAGGPTPGALEYLTGSPSGNGANNEALAGQGPARLGFTGNWTNLDAVAGSVYPRAIGSGLNYTDGSGNSLVTSPGAAEIFRSGTQGGTDPSFQFKRAQRDAVGIAPLNAPLYLSALFQFKAGVEGRLSIGATGAGDDRNHFIGFNTAGNLMAGTMGSQGAGSGASTDAYAADSTHLVIARFVDGGVNNRTVDLWINPSDLTVAGAPDYSFTSDYFQGHTLASVTIGAHMGNGVPNPSFIVDEMRLGSDWDSIAPIPEPATYALLFGLAGLGLVLLRRKMKV